MKQRKRFSAKAYPSRSMAWTKSNCEGTFEEIKKAVENGAVLEKNDYWNKT